jgi:hypothetical protein
MNKKKKRREDHHRHVVVMQEQVYPSLLLYHSVLQTHSAGTFSTLHMSVEALRTCDETCCWR